MFEDTVTKFVMHGRELRAFKTSCVLMCLIPHFCSRECLYNCVFDCNVFADPSDLLQQMCIDATAEPRYPERFPTGASR